MRRGRRKVANRDKVFGCDLQEHLISTAQEIPSVLRNCSEFIEEYGIVDGIYRLSGVSSNTQKLRNEFDTEGTPDLYKDVYLQDIHCVSSLCKAYFRELPNPLLTYELYDRFADAVAVQLEDERLVKIKEVLKDLPAPHYRTLEFLMHHLVKMSSFASQTNMHSRNLAIVWAPNLLRSKDIESTGFNGTAAFMEVRVQSIVVEFILTHVPEVFAASGSAMERRKSLPSPALLANSDDHFFKSLPLHCGNLSPGDGPPLMRPYHAIIDGTDKRKGSLKGRKWKSIFNLGGRLQDPRKKNKYCPKDKEKTSLRPAKSMDSLSSGPFAQDDSKHPPALLLSTANPEGVASVGGGVSSGYAVTYRRTGGAQVSMVSGGTQGTYNRLESLGGAEGSSQGNSRSPGMTSKADRRAGIHISGPFSVTVPLHITSGLALGVLQGGWNEKEQTVQGDAADEEQAETKDEGEQVKASEPEPEQTYTDESKTDDDNNAKESKGEPDAQLYLGEMTTQIIEEEDEETVKSDMTQHEETKEKSVEDVSPQNDEEEYMDMRGHLNPDPGISADGREMDEFSEQDVQDAFGFLDMMDSCASNLFEFSVEAPEEVVEEDVDESTDKETPVSPVQNSCDECETLEVNMSTHRTLAGKSHSLPYKSRPFMPALSLSSDDDYSPEDDEDDEDDSDKDSEYEDMFCQSLPSALDFHRLSWSAPETSTRCADDALSDSQSKCLDDVILPPNSVEPQSLSQWEDTILTAAADDGETPAGTSVQIYNEEQVSADSKMEDLHVDDDKNEVKSDDVSNDTNTMMVEGDPESSDGDEDTYFGADPIPCSLDPNWTETSSISVHETIQEQSVDPPPYTEINTTVEIIITGVTESTDAQDEVNLHPSPDEENMTVRTISDGEEMTTQPAETEKKEESLKDEGKVLQFQTPEREKILSGNEEDPEKELETEECVKDEEITTQSVETEKSKEYLEDEAKVLQFKTPEREKILSGNEEDPEEAVEKEECVKDEEITTQSVETEKSKEYLEDEAKVFELEIPEREQILSGNEEEPEKELETEECVKDEEITTQSVETEKSKEYLEDEAKVLQFKTPEREKILSEDEEDPEEAVEKEECVKDEEMTTQPAETEKKEESLKDEAKVLQFETPEREKILSGNEEEPEKELETEECVKDEEITTQSVETEKSKEYLEDEAKVFELEIPEREQILSGNEEEPEKELEMEECVKDVNETTEDEEEREEVKEHEPCEPAENTEQERVEMENSFDIDKEYNERNVEGTEKDTDDDEHLGNISSEENLCEGDSRAQTEEPVNKKSSDTSDEQPPTAPEDRPVPEEERETSAPKHVKAVPTVPPKPKRSKLTVLTLRKQFDDRDAERQQRHSQVMDADGPHDDETQEHQTDDTCHRDLEKTAENCREPTRETNGGGMPEHDEIKDPRDGSASGDSGIDFRKDLQRDGEREAKRNSGVSMCFDEAVARATEKRSRETSERVSGAQWERECRREGFKHREKDDENKTD